VFSCLLNGMGEKSNKVAGRSEAEDEMEFYEDLSSQYIWWLFGVHLLSILDAYVDAHLWNFDTGPDLSLDTIYRGNRRILLSLNFTF